MSPTSPVPPAQTDFPLQLFMVRRTEMRENLAKTLAEAFRDNYHLINPAKRPTGTGLHPQGWEVPSRGSLLVPPASTTP